MEECWILQRHLPLSTAARRWCWPHTAPLIRRAPNAVIMDYCILSMGLSLSRLARDNRAELLVNDFLILFESIIYITKQLIEEKDQ
jgi:hypothetical protein